MDPQIKSSKETELSQETKSFKKINARRRGSYEICVSIKTQMESNGE